MCKYKSKGHRKCFIKREIKFENNKKCLKNIKTLVSSQQRFRKELQNGFMKKVNKIFFSVNDDNDDKRLQTLDWMISYQYGTSLGIVWQAEMMRHPKIRYWIKWLTLMKLQEKTHKNTIYAVQKFTSLSLFVMYLQLKSILSLQLK